MFRADPSGPASFEKWTIEDYLKLGWAEGVSFTSSAALARQFHWPKDVRDLFVKLLVCPIPCCLQPAQRLVDRTGG